MSQAPVERGVLERRLGAFGLFALAFGSMIGVGWVTGLGGWLSAAGPVGAIVAFLVGGTVMLFIGLCYAELTPMLPVAGGEVAYAYKAFGVGKAFLVGWFLAFGYIAVSAFEAVSVAKVVSYMVPAIDRGALYSVGGQPVYASHLAVAVVSTLAITGLHYAGVRWAAALQTWLTLAFLGVATIFVGAGLLTGSTANLHPVVAPGGSGAAFAGVLTVLVTAPFWFVGFDTIPQGAEEAEASVARRRLGLLIVGSIVAAALFYGLLILSVAMVGPWQSIAASDLPTARAFEAAFGSPVWTNLVLSAALLGLFTSWNGFFLAGSRVLFALGRGRIIPAVFGTTHPRFGTPHYAVLLTGAVTIIGPFLGRDALLAFVNVGSFYIAVAFLGVALSTSRLRRTCPEMERPYRLRGGLLVPGVAALGALGLLAAMTVPGSPAALAWPREVSLLGAIVGLGVVIWMAGAGVRRTVSSEQRDHLILERYAAPAAHAVAEKEHV